MRSADVLLLSASFATSAAKNVKDSATSAIELCVTVVEATDYPPLPQAGTTFVS